MATKTQKRKDLKRAHAVLEIFAEAARLAQEGPSLLHAPPWRLKYPDGDLSYWYGPGSQTELDNQILEYQASIYGGGLWDPAEDAKIQSKKVRKISGREDDAAIRRYIDRFSAKIPDRELDVYMMFFVQVKSTKDVASELGISKQTVLVYLKRLRKRVNDHNVTGVTGPRVRIRSTKNGRFARSSMDMVAPD